MNAIASLIGFVAGLLMALAYIYLRYKRPTLFIVVAAGFIALFGVLILELIQSPSTSTLVSVYGTFDGLSVAIPTIIGWIAGLIISVIIADVVDYQEKKKK